MAEGGERATAVPPDVVQSDYQCGFCLGDVTEPRALPCTHIFCTTCIKQNYNPLTSTTQCKICKKEHGEIDTDTLFAVGIELVSNEKQTEKPPCDVCPEKPQPAKQFCIDCGMRMCEDDTKIHDDSRKRMRWPKHLTIRIEKYIGMPGKYQKRLCVHHKEQISSACTMCFELFCSQCHSRVKEPRESVCDKGKTPHDVAPIAEISATLKIQIGELLTSLHEKMSRGDSNVKEAWKGLSVAEDSVKDIGGMIDRHEEQLIQEVQAECRKCKVEFDQHIEESTTKIEEFTTELDIMRTLLQDLAVEGQLVSSTKHDIDILLLFNDLKSKIEEKLADKTMERTITLPDVFLVEGHPVVDADLRLSYTKAQPVSTEPTPINYADLKIKTIENDLTPNTPLESLETIVAFDGYSNATALLQRKLKEIQILVNGDSKKENVDYTSKTLFSAAESEYAAVFTRHGMSLTGTVYERFLALLSGQCDEGSDMLHTMNGMMEQQQEQLEKEQNASRAEINNQGEEITRLTTRANKLEAERNQQQELRKKEQNASRAEVSKQAAEITRLTTRANKLEAERNQQQELLKKEQNASRAEINYQGEEVTRLTTRANKLEAERNQQQELRKKEQNASRAEVSKQAAEITRLTTRANKLEAERNQQQELRKKEQNASRAEISKQAAEVTRQTRPDPRIEQGVCLTC